MPNEGLVGRSFAVLGLGTISHEMSEPAAAPEASSATASATVEFSTPFLWSGFRGALAHVDPDAIRTALSKQDSLASIASSEDVTTAVSDEVESLARKLKRQRTVGEALTAEEVASVEAVEAAAAEASSEDAAGGTVKAMWAVLRSELIQTSEVVDRETAELDAQLEALDVREHSTAPCTMRSPAPRSSECPSEMHSPILRADAAIVSGRASPTRRRRRPSTAHGSICRRRRQRGRRQCSGLRAHRRGPGGGARW